MIYLIFKQNTCICQNLKNILKIFGWNIGCVGVKSDTRQLHPATTRVKKYEVQDSYDSFGFDLNVLKFFGLEWDKFDHQR